MITAGIDCGAKTTKAIILKDGIALGKSLVPTGFEQDRAVKDSLEQGMAASISLSPTEPSRKLHAMPKEQTLSTARAQEQYLTSADRT